MSLINYKVGDRIRRKKQYRNSDWKASMAKRGITNLDSTFIVRKIENDPYFIAVFLDSYTGYWDATYFELAVVKKYARELE